ncbi:PREDICTED: uncharacterized protein LOC104715586 [Camelina sativa]|uniref:Uncharacterized protein LOC104715586 n=1 Tax=Camelina sativa TaxID=90675 RepID=A0ABM0TTS9_CAMSA|nr:PREDICTED: uncharacterized protein LOC104715586 [Camelina sativa]
MENVLLASEIVANYHKETMSPRSAIKIDISKAFDSVQWPFLLSIFRTLHFPTQFIKWVEFCITTASFSVQVLSALLDKAAEERRVGYHPRYGTKTSIEGILQTFHHFAGVSGLNISLEKSTMYMAGVTATEQAEILQSFPFASGTLSVCYLAHQLSHTEPNELLDVSFPSAVSLHEGDRQYVFCILWSGPSLNTKKEKVAWTDVCLPKEKGGLGLRSLTETNKVSCLKLIWQILALNSLWLDWLRAYLLNKGSFWSIKANTTSGSWMWRKLLKYRDLAVKFGRYEVKNGEGISFWYDNWSPLGCLLSIAGPRGTIDMGIGLHATVAEALSLIANAVTELIT